MIMMDTHSISSTGSTAARAIVTSMLGYLFLMTGCAPVPITDGFHHGLPKAGTRIIVWGNHPTLVETTTTWLKKRGLYALDPSSVGKTVEQSDLKWVHTFKDELAILHAAKDLGAEQAVFVNRSGDRRAPSVSVRGVQVKSNQVLWIGSGRYDDYLKDPENDILAKLTCQALATAWGYRPAGQKRWVSSLGLCMVDD